MSVVWAGLLAVVVAGALPPRAAAEQASEPTSVAASGLDVGRYHACALLQTADVRCWGYGGDGALGYANTASIGDDETPASAGPVDLGGGHRAVAIGAGTVHTCAVLDDGSVRCWGYGGDGRLGYGNTTTIGDDETPDVAGLVNLGANRTAKAITAGEAHTCALLDDRSVRCWGYGGNGQLGYGDRTSLGNTSATTPDKIGSVNLGANRFAVAISAGSFHTCAVLDDGTVRCWGYGGNGRLGYANTNDVLDPSSVGPVYLGAGRTAVAISAGADHTCAVLDDRTVRCWGYGGNGRLGYGNTTTIGDDETPGSAKPVDLGAGRTAVAVGAGYDSTCARLDDGTVRCWGNGANGVLGYCNTRSIGDDETPGSVGPVNLEPGDGGAGCAGPVGLPSAPPMTPDSGPATSAPAGPSLLPVASSDSTAAARAAERLRAAALSRCLSRVSRRARRQRRGVRRLPAAARAVAFRRVARRAGRDRGRCLLRFGRTPGRVITLNARATGPHTIILTFRAAGTDRANPPAARSYLIKQSLLPIRTRRDFRAAHSLCRSRCAFPVIRVDATITQTVTDLTPRRTYYYAIAARDNVSKRVGPRSRTIQARTP